MTLPIPSRLRRRTVLAAGVAAAAGSASAQPGKGRVVKVLLGFPAGHATDIVARLMADQLQQVIGDNYIVENRPGQGGSLALGQLAKAPTDGSVVMLAHVGAGDQPAHVQKRAVRHEQEFRCGSAGG